MTYHNNLLESFNKLRSDSQLSRVIQDDLPCQMQLWILEIHQKQSVSSRLLYGWIIPDTFANGKWSKADVELNRAPDSKVYKAKILKYSFYTKGIIAASLITELLQGTPVSQACRKLQLTEPPDKLEHFALGASADLIARNYAVRPVVFLETQSLNSHYQEFVRPMQSPSSDIPVVVGSLFRLNKLQLWGEEEFVEHPLDCADSLAMQCILSLNEQTGFDFKESDCGRLGNLEWIVFPLEGREEIPAYFSTVTQHVECQRDNGIKVREISCREVDVFLNSVPQSPGSLILMRCRLRNDNEIVLDQTRLVRITEAQSGLRFCANQEICQVQITIWIATDEKRTWTIWYEYEAPLARQLNFAMGLMGLQGQVKLSTLQNLNNSNRIKERIRHYEQVQQTSYHNSKTGNYGLDPWISASRQQETYVKRLFPTVSRGRFFPKGWGAEGPGVLGFAEWFRSLTKRTNNTLVTIVDPYFDTVGIELITHTSTTNTAFEVITCTQLKSNDDDLLTKSKKHRFLYQLLSILPKIWQKKQELRAQKTKPEPEPVRAVRIKKACFDLRIVLSRLRLKVWDLRSEQGGTGSYFHDRYLVISDSNGQAIEGYHLSNSLQAATKFDPLLVTPIPFDILDEVASYVEDLKNAIPPVVQKALVVQLYPEKELESELTDKSSALSRDKTMLELISDPGLFFAKLLQEPTLEVSTIPLIKEHLINEGLLSQDGNVFLIDSEQKVKQRVEAFGECLQSEGAGSFSVLWESFSLWLANLQDSEVYLSEVCELLGDSLVPLLRSYLLDAGSASIEHIKEEQEITFHQFIRFLNSHYNEALDDAYNFLDGRHDYYLFGHFHLNYAAAALMQINPSHIVNILEQLHEQQSDLNPDRQDVTAYIRAVYLLEKLIDHLISWQDDNAVIEALISSRVPSLRALGSQGEWFCMAHELLCSKNTIVSSIPLLLELNETERLFAYAEWIFHMRIQANQKNGELYKQSVLRRQIFDRMRAGWPSDLLIHQNHDVILRLCGPSAGSCANDIYKDLMIPLVQDGRFSSDEAILFWINLLLEKMKGDDKDRISFYYTTDQPLTELCAFIMPSLSMNEWQSVLRRIGKQIISVNREIRRPFANKINYEKWSNNKKTGLWLAIFLEWTWQFSYSREEEITSLVTELDLHFKRYSGDPSSDLIVFANERYTNPGKL